MSIYYMFNPLSRKMAAPEFFSNERFLPMSASGRRFDKATGNTKDFQVCASALLRPFLSPFVRGHSPIPPIVLLLMSISLSILVLEKFVFFLADCTDQFDKITIWYRALEHCLRNHPALRAWLLCPARKFCPSRSNTWSIASFAPITYISNNDQDGGSESSVWTERSAE